MLTVGLCIYFQSGDIERMVSNVRSSRSVKKMVTPNCDFVSATYKYTCSDTVFASLEMLYLIVC